jgi:hypothetical protein
MLIKWPTWHQLSVGAIGVLGASCQKAASNPHGHFHFLQLREAFPQFEPSRRMSLVSELRSLNLLRVQDSGIRMPDDSQALLELTPIGRRFVQRVIEGQL